MHVSLSQANLSISTSVSKTKIRGLLCFISCLSKVSEFHNPSTNAFRCFQLSCALRLQDLHIMSLLKQNIIGQAFRLSLAKLKATLRHDFPSSAYFLLQLACTTIIATIENVQNCSCSFIINLY